MGAGPCHGHPDPAGDLTLVETKRDTGLDFHVTIEREDKPMRLVFGVLLRGVPPPVTAEQANKVLGPTRGQFRGMRKFTYPVCLFFFTVRDERAFVSWLAEPVVSGGAPELVHHDQAKCVPPARALTDSTSRRDRCPETHDFRRSTTVTAQ